MNDLTQQAEVLTKIFNKLVPCVEPGIDLFYIDKLAEHIIDSFGATSYNKGYKPDFAKRPFAGAICLSPNDVVCHGEPTNQRLKSGDILTIDIGIRFQGKAADGAITIPVGEISDKNKKLINTAKSTLYAGIEIIKEGTKLYELGDAMQKHAKVRGYSIIKKWASHAIGTEMHEDPTIPNFRDYNQGWTNMFGVQLFAGQVICLEPHIAERSDNVKFDEPDGFTNRTDNGRNAAMFEHMILVKKDGYEVLTKHFGKEMIY